MKEIFKYSIILNHNEGHDTGNIWDLGWDVREIGVPTAVYEGFSRQQATGVNMKFAKRQAKHLQCCRKL